jgi:hypothetical protein
MVKKFDRHRWRLRLALALAGMFATLTAFTGGEGSEAPKETASKAEQEESSPLSFFDRKIIFKIEERIRGEIRENNRDFHSSIREDNDDSWLLHRFRLSLEMKPVSWLKLFNEAQDARELFSDRSGTPGIRGAEGNDTFDLRQSYVALGDAKRFPLLLTVGRQAVNYGDGRLVADSKWSNSGRTFDAIRARYEAPQFWMEAFAMRPVQIKRHEFDDSDSADHFGGAYFSTAIVPRQTTDFYVFYRDKEDNQPDLDPTNKTDPHGTWNGPAARFATIGTRMKSKPDALGGWDYTGEFAYEAGDVWASDKRSQRSDLNAFALHASGGYTFQRCAWKPRFGLEYDYATGDHNPKDNHSQSFQNLFPSNHEKYGFMDEFGWRNLHDARAQVNLRPVEKLDLEFDYHAFWLADTHDYWYRANGISTLRTRTPDGRDVRTVGAGNFAGHEIDLTATYAFTSHVKVQVGYSHFFAGDYLRDTGPDSDADFGYVMTTLSY